MPPFNYTGHLHTQFSALGLGAGVAITIKLKPTAISQSRNKFLVQFTELNDTSFCDLLNLIWPQPMCLEFLGKLNKLVVIKEH